MIQAPGWKPDAIPTPQGWRHPQTNELLKSQSISQAEIDAYHGIAPKAPVVENVPPAPKPQTLTEAPTTEDDYAEMSKLELEAEGREHGIELDRRKNKETLIEELKEVTAPKAPKPKSRYVKT